MKNSISLRIKNLLKALDKNQSEMARDLGLTAQTVSRWVDKGGIKNEFIDKICFTYKVNKKWLLLEEGEMFQKNENSNPLSPMQTLPQDGNDSLIQKLITENEYLKALLNVANQEKQQLLEVLRKQSGNLFRSLDQLTPAA